MRGFGPTTAARTRADRRRGWGAEYLQLLAGSGAPARPLSRSGCSVSLEPRNLRRSLGGESDEPAAPGAAGERSCAAYYRASGEVPGFTGLPSRSVRRLFRRVASTGAAAGERHGAMRRPAGAIDLAGLRSDGRDEEVQGSSCVSWRTGRCNLPWPLYADLRHIRPSLYTVGRLRRLARASARLC